MQAYIRNLDVEYVGQVGFIDNLVIFPPHKCHYFVPRAFANDKMRYLSAMILFRFPAMPPFRTGGKERRRSRKN
jgi:hypothetical protein